MIAKFSRVLCSERKSKTQTPKWSLTFGLADSHERFVARKPLFFFLRFSFINNFLILLAKEEFENGLTE